MQEMRVALCSCAGVDFPPEAAATRSRIRLMELERPQPVWWNASDTRGRVVGLKVKA